MSQQSPRRRQRRTPEQIETILREFRASGRSRTAFAREHGIAASTLDLWLKKHGERGHSPTAANFVTVELPPVVDRAAGYEVIFPSGVRLLIPAGSDASELATVIAAVAQC